MSKHYAEDNGFAFGVSKERTASQTYIANQDLDLISKLIDKGIGPVNHRQRSYNLAVIKRLFINL